MTKSNQQTTESVEARAKREIAEEETQWRPIAEPVQWYRTRLVAERVKNLELQEEIAELQEELDSWKGML